jgi:hypothetical protein
MIKLAAVVLALAAGAGPHGELFAKNYNLCHAARLAAVRKAAGQPFRAGLFANHACTWSRADLQGGATLSAHPPAVGASLMRSFLSQNGKQGFKAKRIAVPGASKAVIVTLPAEQGHVTKYLFAAYKPGTIQVNLTAPGGVAAARLVALMRLFAR